MPRNLGPRPLDLGKRGREPHVDKPTCRVLSSLGSREHFSTLPSEKGNRRRTSFGNDGIRPWLYMLFIPVICTLSSLKTSVLSGGLCLTGDHMSTLMHKEGNSAVRTSVRIGLEAAIVRPHPPKRQCFAKHDSDTSSRSFSLKLRVRENQVK
jgi:hypothetical protein